MNDLSPCKHHLSSRYRLISGHQLIKLLRLTRLAVMSAITSVNCDKRFDHVSGMGQGLGGLFATSQGQDKD
jgi:hypothetical protein